MGTFLFPTPFAFINDFDYQNLLIPEDHRVRVMVDCPEDFFFGEQLEWSQAAEVLEEYFRDGGGIEDLLMSPHFRILDANVRIDQLRFIRTWLLMYWYQSVDGSKHFQWDVAGWLLSLTFHSPKF